MLDIVFGHAPGQFVIGFAIAQVEAGFQLRAEAIADVGGNAFAVASGVVLIAVSVGICQGDVVVQIPQHLPGTDLTFLIAIAARFVAHLQGRRVVAGMGNVVDRPAQGQ